MISGQRIEVKTLDAIDQGQLKLYADASGDFNPIHLDENEAKKVGLPGVIAHGMLSAAFLAERGREVAQDIAPHFKLLHFQCRFKSMVALGDTITLSGLVKESSETHLVLELMAKNQRGEAVTTAALRYTPKV